MRGISRSIRRVYAQAAQLANIPLFRLHPAVSVVLQESTRIFFQRLLVALVCCALEALYLSFRDQQLAVLVQQVLTLYQELVRVFRVLLGHIRLRWDHQVVPIVVVGLRM